MYLMIKVQAGRLILIDPVPVDHLTMAMDGTMMTKVADLIGVTMTMMMMVGVGTMMMMFGVVLFLISQSGRIGFMI